MLLYELAVNALHRFAGRQAEHQVWVGADIMSNDPGDQSCCSFVSGLNDDFQGLKPESRMTKSERNPNAE